MKIISFFLLILFLPITAHSALVGWYKLNESSGNAIDSSSSGITGTASGTTVVDNCRRNNCRSFNGTTDGIDLGDNFDFVGSSYTGCAWTKPLGATSTGYVWGKYDGQQAYLRRFNATEIYFGIVAGQMIGPVTFTAGEWIHICVAYVYNGTTTIYKNGVSSGSGALTAHTDTARSMFIGNRWDGARPYEGEIDDVRFYDSVLSEAEIQVIYRQGLSSGEIVIGNNSVISNSQLSY